MHHCCEVSADAMLLARGQGARAVAQCRRVQHGCSTAARSAATVPCSPAGQPTPRRAGASLAATTPASSQPAATATGPAGSEPRQGGSGGAEEPSVLVTYRGNTVAVRRGATLRTALLQSGLTPHNGNAKVINCRGLGTCGTCAVEVRWGGATGLCVGYERHSRGMQGRGGLVQSSSSRPRTCTACPTPHLTAAAWLRISSRACDVQCSRAAACSILGQACQNSTHRLVA